MEKQLQQRLGTAAVLIALLASALYFGGWLLVLLALIVYAMINWEFYSLNQGTNAWYKKVLLTFFGFFACKLIFNNPILSWPLDGSGIFWEKGLLFAFDWGYDGENYISDRDAVWTKSFKAYTGINLDPELFFTSLIGLLFLMIICAYYFWKHRKAEPTIGSIEHAILGLFYTGFLGSLIVRLSASVSDIQSMLIWLFAVVACADTFAYFGGRKFGKHKLAPAISPGKTVEGAIFGLFGAVVASVLVAWLVFPLKSQSPGSFITTFIVVGLITGILAILGDLFESLVKRVNGVKDSGKLLPGHGGLLDRLDAFLFTVPVLLWLVTVVG